MVLLGRNGDEVQRRGDQGALAAVVKGLIVDDVVVRDAHAYSYGDAGNDPSAHSPTHRPPRPMPSACTPSSHSPWWKKAVRRRGRKRKPTMKRMAISTTC